MAGVLPHGQAMRVLEDARPRHLLLKPCAELKERRYEGWIECHDGERSKVLGADKEAGHRRQRVHGFAAATRRARIGAEDAGGGEHAHEATQAENLGWVELDRGDYLREGSAAAIAVDGIGNAEVQCGFERHGLEEAEGVVPELELSVEQGFDGDPVQ